MANEEDKYLDERWGFNDTKSEEDSPKPKQNIFQKQ